MRAGIRLSPRDEATKRDGLVLILRDLHDAVDAAVFAAYGWPEGMKAAEIVERLVALNMDRAAEEATGLVRYLHPAFQADLARDRAQVPAPRLPFSIIDRQPHRNARPRLDRDEPLAIQAVLVRAGGPLATGDLVSRFQGRGRQARIERALSSLYRYGHVNRLPDGRWVAARGP